ncbi:caspase-3-like [Paroedura picta]|uniref:caspase-3-like n=1 Tax=Paroedura picta TaxID=143630 RepID=UPI00405745F1
MANQRKNRALVIVNFDFYRSPAQERLPARPGAKKEADRLFKALSDCNYTVELRYDLTAKQICRLYEKECNEDHGDCFVSILSSHGEEGVIFDCKGQPVELTQIYKALSPPGSHKLAGKPKILFIQACRGQEIDPGVWLQTDSAEAQTDYISHYLSVPEDTTVMFACSPGYAAFINCWESAFLKALLKLLEGENRQRELTRLMTWINREVAFNFEAKGKHSGGKEMPCFVTKMVRDVYPFSSQRTVSSRQ